jgi:leucyl aminopeptidase (aminopeptidase T)
MTTSDAAARGAENVIARCLAVRAGERVAIVAWRTSPLVGLLVSACTKADAEPIVHDAEEILDLSRFLDRALDGVRASVLLAAHGVPPPLSMAMLSAARERGLRHLHLTRADARLFEQSYRAEPARIAELNERVRQALERARSIEARGENGTALTIGLAPGYPLLAADGRPIAGRPDNLPSGFVFFHPASASGTVVADRGLLGAIRIGRDRLRGAPVSFELEAGKLRAFHTSDEATRREIEGYLASHSNAGHVGLVSIPTNYVIRAESGLEVQDALLPGLGLSLGFSDHEHTRAPFHCPVQLRILSRKLDVNAGSRAITRAGRMVAELVEGIDPFR